MASRIPSPEIDATLAAADEWERKGGVLKTTYTFDSFRNAFDFMIEVAEIAEEIDHHPTWTNRYDKVEIELTTHELGGITDMDLALALRISKIYDKRAVA